jgi:hypothetical protein
MVRAVQDRLERRGNVLAGSGSVKLGGLRRLSRPNNSLNLIGAARAGRLLAT